MARISAPELHQFAQALNRYYADQATTRDAGWAQLPELPSSAEILGVGSDYETPRFEDLAANKLHEIWEDREEYLEAHFNLIRFDALSRIRASVQEIRETPLIREKDSETGLRIYDKVFVTGLTVSTVGLCPKIRFQTTRASRRVRWEQSVRLRPGAIVCLSPVEDSFKSICIVAVVAARPLFQLNTSVPEVDIELSDLNDIFIDAQQEYVMVESQTAYYESSRHCLTALQKLSRESFPFQDYIVKGKTRIANISPEDSPTEVDVSAAFNDVESPILFQRQKLQLTQNVAQDTQPVPKLEESQLKALMEMLTKEFAIIQGPPGTGKTFVSIIYLLILLANHQPGDPPVIIAAQTNHAVDQLLRLVHPFYGDFVRLGARSKDKEVVVPRTIRYLQEQNTGADAVTRTTYVQFKKDQKSFLKDLEKAFAPLHENEGLLTTEHLLKLGVITESEAKSLQGTSDGDALFPDFERWAAGEIVHFSQTKESGLGPSYGYDNLEYEPIDVDALEDGLVDDDNYPELNGYFVTIPAGYCSVPDSHNRDEEDEVDEDDDEDEDNNERPNTKYQNSKTKNVYDVPTHSRGHLYDKWHKQQLDVILQKVKGLAHRARALTRQAKVSKACRMIPFLKNTRLLGMTTTGLAKNRGLLSVLKPKYVLIEEAAETLEAHIVVACLPSVVQMVIVGDHQQLRPSCQDVLMEALALHISLFERLVTSRSLPFVCLTNQRRMRPEIRRVIRPLYPELKDDKCTKGRPDVPGMKGVNVFFFTHMSEETNDENNSKQNYEEAGIIVGYASYLVDNGVNPDKITILTFYNGQRRMITSMFREHRKSGVLTQIKVATVDSFQGEENDIIILSLVRNNRTGHIGFLENDNRVCVALSRARLGFYLFGNAQIMLRKSSLWKKVITYLHQGIQAVFEAIPIRCEKHGADLRIRTGNDWIENEGGCNTLCAELMDCGHRCSLKCHSFEHTRDLYSQQCMRRLKCGHPCRMTCRDECRCEECKPVKNRFTEFQDDDDDEDEISKKMKRLELTRPQNQQKWQVITPRPVKGKENAGKENTRKSSGSMEHRKDVWQDGVGVVDSAPIASRSKSRREVQTSAQPEDDMEGWAFHDEETEDTTSIRSSMLQDLMEFEE